MTSGIIGFQVSYPALQNPVGFYADVMPPSVNSAPILRLLNLAYSTLAMVQTVMVKTSFFIILFS
jgi:hypothetical protein